MTLILARVCISFLGCRMTAPVSPEAKCLYVPVEGSPETPLNPYLGACSLPQATAEHDSHLLRGGHGLGAQGVDPGVGCTSSHGTLTARPPPSSGCSDGLSKNTPGPAAHGHQPNPRECLADRHVRPAPSSLSPVPPL